MRVYRGVSRHFRMRWPEWCLAWTLFFEGLNLLQSQGLSVPTQYRLILRLVPEREMAGLALAIAAVWIVALVLNGTFVTFRRASPWARACISLCAACYWSAWAIIVFQSSHSTASNAFVNHASFATMSFMCFLMSGREVAYADERAARCRSRQRPG